MFLVGAGLAAATLVLPHEHALFAPAWIGLAFLTSSFFFVGYVLLDNRSKTRLPLYAQMGFVRPFWAGFAAPMKGPAFIFKAEARSDADLAVSRLKGVKLAAWALILFLTWEWGFNRLIHDIWAFPRLDDLIVASAAGDPASLGVRWGAVAVDFMAMVIYMGAAIHAVVAVVRVSGFCIPRGMVSPARLAHHRRASGAVTCSISRKCWSIFFFLPDLPPLFQEPPPAAHGVRHLRRRLCRQRAV